MPAKKTKAETKIAAEGKISEALEAIEEAQRQLEKACRLLSPIVGAAPEWRRVAKIANRAGAEWMRIDLKLESGRWAVDLDGTAKAALGKSREKRLQGPDPRSL